MRVLHVLDHSLPVRDGYAFRSHALMQAQRERGWHVALTTSPKHYESSTLPWTADETIGGVRCYRTRQSASTTPVLAQIQLMRSLAARLTEVIGQERPDILHAHSPTLNFFPAARAARRFGLPVVYEIRASWEDAAVSTGKYREGSWQYRATRALETRACRSADHLTVICQGLKDDLVRRGIPESKITIIPNGVDLEKFTPGQPDPAVAQAMGLAGRSIVAFFGSFFRWEGLDLLVDAMALIRARRADVALLLVGAGAVDAELRQAVERRALGDCVVMPGHMPQERIASLYPLADVLAYPRHSSRLTELVTPLKPLEAMAMRKAVVASDVGGHRELIQNGVTGALFKAGDAGALAATLERLIDFPEERRALAERGHGWVREHRSWAATTQGYTNVYPSLVRAS